MPAVDSTCVTGVIFFNNVGYLGMCGHGIIGVVVTLAHRGTLDPGTHAIETPVGIVTAVLHTDGRVLVCDRENNRIQIFSPEGEFLTQWTGLARPCDIYIDSDDVVFVPELDAFMTILTIGGEVISKFAGPTEAGAHAIWMDSHGDLYINQNLEGQRLLKYRRCG